MYILHELCRKNDIYKIINNTGDFFVSRLEIIKQKIEYYFIEIDK